MNHNGTMMHGGNRVSTLIMPGRRYFDKELNSKSKWNQLYFAEFQIASKMHLRIRAEYVSGYDGKSASRSAMYFILYQYQ